jgi:hypothetical protein
MVTASRPSLIARSRCARCSEIGHSAAGCSNPPDARGAANAAGTTNATQRGSANPVVHADFDGSSGYTVFYPWAPIDSTKSLVQPMLSACTLEICTGPAVVDTGAQHGITGDEQLRQLTACLATFERFPCTLDCTAPVAIGVWGPVASVAVVERPISIAQHKTVVELHVIGNSKLPPLLASLLKRMECS